MQNPVRVLGIENNFIVEIRIRMNPDCIFSSFEYAS
jgi:hypothetical protein